MYTEYGHFRASFGGKQFEFIPSFDSMVKIGNPEDLMKVFSDLFHIEQSDYLQRFHRHHPFTLHLFNKHIKRPTGVAQLKAAHLVLSSCCKEDCSSMIGKYVFKDKVYYQPGFESPKVLIRLAQHLITHGVIGDVESKVVNKSREPSTSISLSRFVELARLHLNLSRDEAWSLTMTEFLKLWGEKFPPSEKEKDAAMDEEEYMDCVARLEAIRDKTLGVNNG